MTTSPFQEALDAVRKPLAFAERDDFAGLDRVRDLATTVADAARRAARLAVPKDARDGFLRLAKRFEQPLEGEDLHREICRTLEGLRKLADPAWSEAALARSPSALPGLGPKRADKLARRGLATVADLLFHLPVRYDDRRSLVPVGQLEVGQHVTFVAKVLVSDFVSRRGRPDRWGRAGRMFEAVVGDGTGSVNLKWFHASDAIARLVKKDARLLITGDVKRYRFNKEIAHPEIELLPDEEADCESTPESVRSIVPDYATPEGIHPRGLRRAIQAAVESYADLVSGHLPQALVHKRGLPKPADSLRLLHAPPLDTDLDAVVEGRDGARTRLVLEELYLLELGLALRRESRGREAGIAIDVSGPRTAKASVSLPFQLTRAQQRAVAEIVADLSRGHPMNRLLEGDVGSGKTVVAFLAAVAVTESGFQTALMAPTELLAEQHSRTLKRLVRGAGAAAALRVELLTSSVPRAEADRIRAELAAGEIDLVVGTHALLQESVGFHRLAFVVIDEQHRFGVRQRAALAAKAADGKSPHTLVMTATPIPRTLALTAHGDLDLSILDELPPGRLPTTTLLLRDGEGARVTRLLRETVERGEQVFVVYPLVEESEKTDLRAASESAEKIRRAFPQVAVDLVHGRLDSAARAEAMARFESGETGVLVSTTVIEVGIDVPNATLMIVEHAERFGLAQLHQLRGRVGRGEKPGTCVLVARGFTEDSEARMRALIETTDGFEIAEADLRIRGPGEFLGTRQHGFMPDLRIADLVRDVEHVAVARDAALGTVGRDPGLNAEPTLMRAVRARWGERLDLAGVG